VIQSKEMTYLKELPPFQHFGSMDSQDIDLVFFIDTLPSTIVECAEKCLAFNAQYAALFEPIKKLNSNLIVVNQGVIKDAFKGNLDELNNSLLLTYHLHPQYYPNAIKRFLERDVDLKFLRASRSILSVLTKTRHRTAVKNALKGAISLKLNTLENIDLTTIDWSNSKMALEDIKKMLAFQIGQTLALFCGQEVYTKNDIALIFPKLKPYLNREKNTGFNDLQSYLMQFNAALKTIITTIKSDYEYKYK
jgi:hypothetical protein